MIEAVGKERGRLSGAALSTLALVSAAGVWLWAAWEPRASSAPEGASLLPTERDGPGDEAAAGDGLPIGAQRQDATTPNADSGFGRQPAMPELPAGLRELGAVEYGDPSALQDPLHARTRDWYGEFLRQEQARAGALGEVASDVLAGDGPRAQKIALLRALQDAPAADAMHWFEHAVRTLPDLAGARGASVPSFALGLIARAAPREPAARAKLAELAFRAPEVLASLRRRSAALYAAHCPVNELGDLRRQLLQEPDKSIAGAALAAVDARANEHPVALWLVEFEEWERPRVSED